jgi:hypothetical protein
VVVVLPTQSVFPAVLVFRCVGGPSTSCSSGGGGSGESVGVFRGILTR